MKHKVIVCHPSQQHSFRLATALNKSGDLFAYITTVYDKKNSILMKIIKAFVSEDNRIRASARKTRALSDDQVLQFYMFYGLIEIFLSRYDKNHHIYNYWQRRTAKRFGIKAAKYAIKNEVDAVITYDMNAFGCFDYLKKHAPNIIRIMDVSAANRIYMKDVYEKDFELCPTMKDKLLNERSVLWEKGFIDRVKNEIELTQYYLVPSNFVKKSLEYSGVEAENIRICPYGADLPKRRIQRDYKEGMPLKAIYVGNVTEMKGIYYLLEAALQFDPKDISFVIVGNYDNSNGVFDKYIHNNNITFTGRVLHDKVIELLCESDVFVFPSLGEGMSLSALEAMSCGLPCILTNHSGADDLIENGINGFIVNPQSVDDIVNRLKWCINNRKELNKMSKNSERLSQEYTWEKYDERVSKEVNSIISRSQ